MPHLGRIRVRWIIGLLGLVATTFVSAVQGDGRVYTVGVVPQFEVRKLHRIWHPILDEIAYRTGHRFEMIGSPTIPDFEREFMSGNFDFAYMNPYHIVLASDREGYIPLVRDVGRTLHGVLVARVGWGIDEVADLEGKVVAFPAPNALGASLLIRQVLADKFGVEIRPQYVKTHDSVYLSVVLGQAAAGGGVQKTLGRQIEEVQAALKVIYRTTPITPHPFAAHPRVPEQVRREVKEALLEIGAGEQGRRLLDQVPITQIGIASMADYQPLRVMELERFYQGQQ